MTTLTRLIKNPLGAVGFFLVLFWVAIALLSPVISPPGNSRDPYMIARTSFSSIPKPPSDTAAFGTTSGGYDILYGITWGSRTAFKVGLIVVSCSALIGIALGGFGAFYGGWVDELVMRLTDLFMSFPFLIAVIVMSIVLGKGLEKVIFALILFGWRNYARVVRSEVLSIKEKEYVQAAISVGAGRLRIFVRHILPNAVFPIFVLATIDIGTMVRIAAALSFLGVGAEPGYADWGQMINLSRQWLLGIVGDPFHYWYTYVFPGIAILTFVLGWTLLGDALRDILDPRLS